MFSCNLKKHILRNPQFYQMESGKLVLSNMYPYDATYIPGKSKGRVLLDRNKFKYIHNKTNNLKTKAYYVCSYKRTHNCNDIPALGQIGKNKSRDTQRAAKHKELKSLVDRYEAIDIKCTCTL